jgi:uncharacterized protein YwqG
MGFFERLFGRKGSAPSSARDVPALMAPLVKPALQLRTSSGAGRSYLGGMPALPVATPWPTKSGAPLTFLASLDLASLQAAMPIAWLPSSGRLLFFYDVEGQPWGFDPKDRGSWAVLFAGDDAPLAAPAMPPASRSLPGRAVSCARIATYPSPQRPDVAALGLNEDEADRLGDLTASVYGDAPCHQVAGCPNPIQGDDMELECQLASHGIYCGDSSGHHRPEVAALRDGAGDWRLLLQLDSDDDLEVMWGDSGMLYFWIREEDARAGRFDNTWLVLQCY